MFNKIVQPSKRTKVMKQTKSIIRSNYFFIKRKKLGDNNIIEFSDINGSIWHYDHDLVYKQFKTHFDTMPCFIKKKEYTSTRTVPLYVQELDCVKIINR